MQQNQLSAMHKKKSSKYRLKALKYNIILGSNRRSRKRFFLFIFRHKKYYRDYNS